MNNRTLMLTALFALPTLVAAQTPQIPQTPGQKITVPLSDPTRAGSLHVGVISGSITVKGTNRKDVLIEVRQRDDEDEDRDEEEDKSVKKPSAGLREIPQPASFSVEEANNRVEVSSRIHGGRANDFVIEVPARFDLELSAINDGDIAVEGVDGEHEISNVNGEITLDRVGGSVVAHTTNGAVKATLTRVTAGKPMAFTTLNGDVDLTIPAATKANLRLRSDNGQLFTDFDFTAQVAEVQESREQGRTMKEIGKYIGGSINGGGPVFELRSFSGDVYVRKGPR